MTQLVVMSQLFQLQLVEEESRCTTAALRLMLLAMDLEMG